MYNPVCDISETDKLQHYCLLRVFYQKICFGTNEIYCLLSVRHAKAALVMYLAVKFTVFFLILCFFFSGRNSTCYVRDWVGYIVSLCLILFGIVSITVINVYKEKIKDEVYGIILAFQLSVIWSRNLCKW